MGKNLKISNLSLGYENQTVIKNFNLEINAGQLVAVAGPNGSGKTTLLKGLAKLLKPEKGQIFWADQNINNLSFSQTAKIFGYLSQTTLNEIEFTVEEMVLLGRYPHLKYFWQIPEQEKEKVKKILTQVGIGELAKKPITQLSGGELQKTRIARVLAQEPEVLFLDEPTTHLDIKAQIFILELLKNLISDAAKQNRPILVVATFHDLNQVMFFADKVILLSAGLLVAQGEPKEIIKPEIICQVYGLKNSDFIASLTN